MSASQQRPKPDGRSRRRFLIGLGVGVVAVAVGGPPLVGEGRFRLQQVFLSGEQGLPELPASPFVWVEFAEGNRARLFIPKVEMGQGIHTALAQIAADELELDWALVEVHQADMARGFVPELLFTFGSTSVTALYRPIRQAAANMREMLRAEAAARLGQPLDSIVAQASHCALRDAPDQALSYHDLVVGKRGEWSLPSTAAPLKPNAEFRLIGQPLERVDLREKLLGRAIYGYDARLPGMLYGAVARPPRYGATLRRAEPGNAASQPGVVRVVITDGFAGVVARSRSQARRALEQLELEWQGGTTLGQAELEQLVNVPDHGGVEMQRAGNVGPHLRAPESYQAEFRTPLGAHAHLEPQAALADVRPDGVTIYASTQVPGMLRDQVAKALGRPAEQINVIPTYLGGGFGRKSGHDVGAEAARLSAAVGQPVHVGWTRAEDMQHGFFRPPTHHRLRATLDQQGTIVALENQLASGDVLFGMTSVTGPAFFPLLFGADPLSALGMPLQYNVPNHRLVLHRVELPVPTATWRGLGLLANTFACESFMDELAARAGADPLEFRLRHLPDTPVGRRLATVLRAAAERAGWGTPAPAGRARGLACCLMAGTVVAEVAEVALEEGQPRVYRVVAAVDPGLLINPDTAAAQVQGSIIMGLSATLHEQITLNEGMAAIENFNAYPLLGLGAAPAIEVLFVPSSDEPIGGLGEGAVGPIAAAVANAVAALTGQRTRSLPLRYV